MNAFIDKRQKTKDKRRNACGLWLIAIIFLLTIATSVKAQTLQSYDNKNYNDNVQTVLLHPTADSLAKL